MAQNSKIEWTDHTANLWHGCTKVHEGCDNCYAEALAKRFGSDIWGNDKPRKIIHSVFNDLDKYQRLAKEAGEIHNVFVGSMMDIFEKPMPLVDTKGESIVNINTGMIRDTFFKRISENRYSNLNFLLLTKRPSNINKYIPEDWKTSPPENVMFGTSPVNQETANKLIPQLLRVKGRKFISIEPQLGLIDLTMLEHGKGTLGHSFYQVLTPVKNAGDSSRDAIEWIIQGGESGHHKRPFNLEWAYFMKQQCADAKVPYFFKQIDKIKEIPSDLLVRQFPIV